jgi:hypothetical protein
MRIYIIAALRWRLAFFFLIAIFDISTSYPKTTRLKAHVLFSASVFQID